ncbi:methenyltetrahydrofolate synthase domain-containing protein [Copidosoma floridanum]|uniref:methenyltetrahydrofolate synthase domain-containing protein n=1 Tax=Copidosoma floridanum TaxID=29053 RepID=UPI0006C99CED|nr:methenyltetrahydrofolate synthase domain-containing protein [Copidosoma floridanum]
MAEEKNNQPSDVMVEEKPKAEATEEKQVEEAAERKPSDAVEEKPISDVAEEKQPEVKTKQSFREKMWVHMAKEKLTRSFRSLCSRIPFFNGYDEATKRLTELNEYKEAKLLMISPDKPQESVIIASLQQKKEVLIPRPRLLSGLFYRVKSAADLPEEEAKDVVVRYDIKQVQTPINFHSKDLKVDMLVLGSVCVNKAGYRIGEGEGFVDLEYAILSKMKAVDENTIIVTTVHDCQILDDLPNELFEPHDVAVDVIITPTQTIVVNPKLKRPNDIIWSNISEKRLERIPILKEIKALEET